jgi:nucleoid-associated protein YgaU
METHTAKAGDSILSLARDYYGNIRYAKTLLEANPQVKNATDIPAGTVVYLPDVQLRDAEPAALGSSSVARAVKKNATPTAKKPTRKNPAPGKTTRQPVRTQTPGDTSYVVRSGDSLYQIARAKLGEGTRWNEIYELNKAAIGGDPAALKIGQRLRIPKK